MGLPWRRYVPCLPTCISHNSSTGTRFQEYTLKRLYNSAKKEFSVYSERRGAMKKVFIVLLAMVFAFSLAACGSGGSDGGDKDGDSGKDKKAERVTTSERRYLCRSSGYA